MPKNISYETYKKCSKCDIFGSYMCNKKQETPVRSYFYLLFHCTTSCS